jgi:hypothetical protein
MSRVLGVVLCQPLPGFSVVKTFFSSSLTSPQNKLECFSLTSYLVVTRKARAYPSGATNCNPVYG